MKPSRAAPWMLLTVLPLRAAAAECDSLEPLRWLAGDWIADGDKTSFHESWRELGPDELHGAGIERAKADGAIKGAEDLRLVRMGDGVFYVSKVSHNTLPVAFRLTACADGLFIFENVAHDFPKRLEYRRKGETGLAVRVSDGGDKGFVLAFARAESTLLAGERLLIAEDARFRAMVAAETATLKRWLDEDLEYVHSTGMVEGRDQLIESIAAGRIRYLGVEPVERYVSILAPDVGLVHGIGRFKVSAGGEPMELLLHYAAVYVARDGDWRLRSWQSLQLPKKRSET